MDWGNWNERLKAKKKQSHKTDADLAAAVFGHEDEEARGRAAVNHWLNKRRPITLEAFFTICEELGADPGEILFGVKVLPELRGGVGPALAATGHDFEPPEMPPKIRRFKATRAKLRTK